MNAKFKQYLGELCEYMQSSGIGITPLPKVQLNNQPQDQDSIMCTTGYYNPQTKVVTLFTHGRHEKDVLRSFAHEMIHHAQNLAGEMSPEKIGESSDSGDPKYAQNNPHLRKLEEDAYLRGNMTFRDWTDNKKYGK